MARQRTDAIQSVRKASGACRRWRVPPPEAAIRRIEDYGVDLPLDNSFDAARTACNSSVGVGHSVGAIVSASTKLCARLSRKAVVEVTSGVCHAAISKEAFANASSSSTARVSSKNTVVPTLDSAAANIPSMAASMRAEDWWLVFMAFIADCRFIDVFRHERAIK